MLRIFDILFPPRADERTLRDISVDDLLALVQPRLVPETRPGTVALLPFKTPIVRAAIHEAKYHGTDHAFTHLASALAEYLRDPADVGFRKPNIVLVPIPLGKQRRKERGYNQVQEVIRRAIKELAREGCESYTLESLLERTRETASQVSLPRHLREENMRGTFRATRRADPRATYILVDDVLTTGATLQAGIDALRAAGATTILPLAFAH